VIDAIDIAMSSQYHHDHGMGCQCVKFLSSFPPLSLVDMFHVTIAPCFFFSSPFAWGALFL
jgi:hypothetical protein